jgi:hypothetical protein
MSYDPGSLVQHNCFTVGEFYREHGKMRDQVKKRHSVQSTTAEEEEQKAPAPASLSRGKQSEKNDASLLGGARSRETHMVLSVAAAAGAAGGNDKDEASSDLKCHIQSLLEATIEQSGLMERQIAAIGQCGWNILR